MAWTTRDWLILVAAIGGVTAAAAGLGLAALSAKDAIESPGSASPAS